MLLGIDWSQVDWGDVLRLLGISLALTLAALAAIRFLPFIPAARRRLFYLFALLIIWTPVGLITPGVAYGEWLPQPGDTALPGTTYIPQGIARLSSLWQAPLAGYQVPGVGQAAPVLQQAPG